jgi:dipeptidyl aminopeptidase/acylaminoacyl peptidase
VLFGNPHQTSPEISPDGTLVGFVAPLDGVLNVWVGPLDGSQSPEPVTHDADRGIAAFGFCHDDRTLIYLQDDNGDENWRIHLLDLPTGDIRCVTPPGARARILKHGAQNPTTVLIGLNANNPQLPDVYRLDITSGDIELIAPNPGFATWLIDNQLQVRGGMAMTDAGDSVLQVRDDSGEYLPWRTISADDLAATDVIGFNRSSSTLYLLSSADANATRLVAIDLKTGAESVVAEDLNYDIGAVVQDPETLEPQALVFAKERDEWLWLDDDLGAEVAEVRRQLRLEHGVDGEIALGRNERSGRLWLMPVMPSNGPTTYFLHDRETKQTRRLFSHKPDLENYELAAMEPFAFNARDGLRIHGYVTFPPRVPRRQLPAVVIVHGGPRARDSWGFRSEVQWLANRGYVCLQVNFRGSTGYGKAFSRAGHKEWGRKMLFDLIDAVGHATDQGWIDRGRVGIMGASYGGYTALAGAAFTPDVFRCAIDLFGPSNLLTLLDSIPAYWKPMASYLHATVGDPVNERDMLWDRSPLAHAENVAIPMLIVQGKNDPRVKVAESEQIVDALRRNGLPYEYLLFDDEGHGLARPENRERFYARAEEFLSEHLGGRRQTDETVEQTPERASELFTTRS